MARLFFRYSVMGAGKSAEILRIAHNYEKQKKGVLLFTSKIDTRHGEGIIASRMGIQKKAIPIGEDTDISALVKESLREGGIHCVLVDEAQFLSRKHVCQLAEVVDDFDIPVIAYGLKNTFNNKLFEGTEALLIYADKIEEIKTVCWHCDRKAIMNLRINEKGFAVSEGSVIQIGYSYLPVCRKCYREIFEDNKILVQEDSDEGKVFGM